MRPSLIPWSVALATGTVASSLHPHLPLSGKKKPSECTPADSSALDCPPLSPATLHLLGSYFQSSPSFDSSLLHPSRPAFPQHPPPPPPSNSPTPSVSLKPLNLPTSSHVPHSLPGTSCFRPRSLIRSGCFNTPFHPVLSAGSAQHSSSDPCRKLLKDLPFRKRSANLKRGRCMRAIDSDFNITFGEEAPLLDVMDTGRRVLVGRVRGRTYSVESLKLWVEEIWGTFFKELPEIKVLARGWFALHFHRPEYTHWVLSQYWHIELAPVMLKRWDPLFDPKREQLGAGPIWVRPLVCLCNFGTRMYSSELGTLSAPTWSMTNPMRKRVS